MVTRADPLAVPIAVTNGDQIGTALVSVGTWGSARMGSMIDELLQHKPPPRMAVEVEGKTVYFPIAEVEPLEGGGAQVTMRTTDWLDAGTHSAILIDGDTRTRGYLSVYDYRSNTGKIEIIAVWREAPA